MNLIKYNINLSLGRMNEQTLSYAGKREKNRHATRMAKLMTEFVKELKEETHNTAMFKQVFKRYNQKWLAYCRKQEKKFYTVRPNPEGFKKFVNDNKKRIKELVNR